MGVMIGKAVKLAEGNLDTHSHKVTMNRDFIQLMLNEACIPLSSLHVPTTGKHTLCLDKESPLSTLNMARELWEMIPEEDMERFARAFQTATVLERHDDTVWGIVRAEAEPFFAGERSAEDCAAQIQSRVQIYLSEQCP
jgi:cobalamin biosynthesis protein CbiD